MSQLGRPTSGKRRLKDLLVQHDNCVCADYPKWASANIGVFIYLKCCGMHISLGTYISKVLSVTLDECHEERSKFIRSKYELQEFLKPSLRITSASKKGSLQARLSQKIMNNFRSSSSSSQQSEGMVEFIGMLKIIIIKGTNLAVRDMLSSDPYVVLTLGKKHRQRSLNPVWNEELVLSVPQDFDAIKLVIQVFDCDTFSADDIMGEAEIDIQPMITSAMAFGDAGMFGNMQIGKWMKSHDNALIDDNTVNIVDGKVKQAVLLKLQNVESGELDLELEWVPLERSGLFGKLESILLDSIVPEVKVL
ncbi:ADP-ribosylation factor GTPase-activating AGD12-like [Olea europaea subsp. europaea]|uniref:ADP-ribosylation factor GTPase-activating AGD12-like n=1 Tax=Olea europaea subsp. europaea TaxID=158383 RepID=A0A8S0PEF2_OLEEU|nr:ADP-ribosylation factor GTPase-activating AGD12-like [Olea europaea subsp. europaea]